MRILTVHQRIRPVRRVRSLKALRRDYVFDFNIFFVYKSRRSTRNRNIWNTVQRLQRSHCNCTTIVELTASILVIHRKRMGPTKYAISLSKCVFSQTANVTSIVTLSSISSTKQHETEFNGVHGMTMIRRFFTHLARTVSCPRRANQTHRIV